MSNLFYQWYFELKRRKVFKSALAYGAVSWLLLQVTEIVAGALNLPDWTTRLVLILLLIVFPLVLVLAWVFDLGPSGMVRTSNNSANQEWLGAVVWIQLAELRDDVGNLASKPRVLLERKILTTPSLWRHWQGVHGQLVFNSAHHAIETAAALTAFGLAHQIPLQVGIAVGSVHLQGETIHGEAVQVAQVMAENAKPNAICGTEQIHDELLKSPELGGEFLGPVTVDALAHPVRMYRLEWQSSRMPENADVPKTWLLGSSAALLLLLAVGGASVWYWQAQPLAIPTVSNDSSLSSGKYIRIDPIVDSQLLLTEAQAFVLAEKIKKSLEMLPGIYPEDSTTSVNSVLSLQSSIQKKGELWSLTLRMDTGDGNQPELIFTEKTLQSLMLSVQSIVARMLATELKVNQEPLPDLPPMSESLFAVLVDTQYSLAGVPKKETLERVEAALTPYLVSESHPMLWMTHCFYLLQRAEMLYEPETMEKASHSCEKINSGNKVNAEARIIYARYLKLKGRTNDAIHEVELALSVNPRNSEAYDLLSQMQQAQGNTLLAEHTLLKAITFQPGYWRPFRRLALFQYKNSRYDDAAKNYKKVIELSPNSGRAWSDYGAAHLMAGNLNEAADAFNRAVQLEPNQAGYSNLGTLYYYLGRYNDAIRQYQLALKDSPNDYRLYGNIADVYRQQQRSEESHNYYQQALSLLETYTASTVEDVDSQSLSLLYRYYLGVLPNAYEEMLRLIEQHPENAELQLYAAIMARPQSDTSKVILHLEKAMSLGLSGVLISVDPDFSYLGAEPRFTRLVAASVH